MKAKVSFLAAAALFCSIGAGANASPNGAFDSTRATVNAVAGVNVKQIVQSAGVDTIAAMLRSAAGHTFTVNQSGVPDGSNDCNCSGQISLTVSVSPDGQSAVLSGGRYCMQYGCVSMPTSTINAASPRVTVNYGFYGAGNGDERAYVSVQLTASGINVGIYVEDAGFRGQWICALANNDDIQANRNLRSTFCQTANTGFIVGGDAGVHPGPWSFIQYF